MEGSFIAIDVKNWEKFNARTDRVNYTWFRFQNDFFHDQAIFGMPHSVICLYLVILCEVSKKNKDKVSFQPAWLAMVLNLKEKDVIESLDLLATRGLVSWCHHDGSLPPNGDGAPPTDRQTDKQTPTSEEFPELATDLNRDLLDKIKKKKIRQFLEDFKDASYIKFQLDKASLWCKNNPAKARKRDWDRFMGGWLERNWEDHIRKQGKRTLANTTPIDIATFDPFKKPEAK